MKRTVWLTWRDSVVRRLAAAWTFLLFLCAWRTAAGAEPFFPYEPIRMSISQVGQEGLRVSWRASAGGTYQVQFSSDVSRTNWTPISPWISATNSVPSFETQTGTTSGFYRVLFDYPAYVQFRLDAFSLDAGDFYLVLSRDTNGTQVVQEIRLRRLLGQVHFVTTNAMASTGGFETRSGFKLQLQTGAASVNLWQIQNEMSDRTKTLNLVLADLRADERVQYAFPVYYWPQGDLRMLATPQLVMALTPGVKLSDLSDLLAAQELLAGSVTGPSSPTNFFVYLAHPKRQDPLLASRRLMEDSRVRWAVPNFLQELGIIPPPTPPRETGSNFGSP